MTCGLAVTKWYRNHYGFINRRLEKYNHGTGNKTKNKA